MSDEKVKMGFIRRAVVGDLSLFGGVRSLGRNLKNGASVVSGGIFSIKSSTVSALSKPKIETFTSACERLNLDENALPKIHNQILLQLYCAAFVGLGAVFMLSNYVLFLNGTVMVELACLAISLACVVTSAQASIQAYQIREKKLGLRNQWFSKPEEWFPSRIEFAEPIQIGDSRCDPKMTLLVAARSRRNFYIFILMIFLAIVLWLTQPPSTLPGAALLTLGLSGFVLSRAIRNSLFVLQAKDGKDYDMMYWLMMPSAWFPTKKEKIRKSKLSAD